MFASIPLIPWFKYFNYLGNSNTLYQTLSPSTKKNIFRIRILCSAIFYLLKFYFESYIQKTKDLLFFGGARCCRCIYVYTACLLGLRCRHALGVCLASAVPLPVLQFCCVPQCTSPTCVYITFNVNKWMQANKRKISFFFFCLIINVVACTLSIENHFHKRA